MDEGIHILLKAEHVMDIFGVHITNTVLMSWLVVLILCFVGYVVGSNLEKIPGRLQTFFEMFFSFFIDYVEEVLDSRTLAKRFFPILMTFFMFILLGNWFELVPGIHSITVESPTSSVSSEVKHEVSHTVPGVVHAEEKVENEHESERVSLFYPVSVDLNFTLAMALIAFVIIEVSGIMFVGLGKYVGKFINFSSPINFLVGIIELISEVARILSFSFRLFGNMFAGETLITVAMFFVPLILPMSIMFYEFFVGIIQASIFTLLTLFFIKLSISEPH